MIIDQGAIDQKRSGQVVICPQCGSSEKQYRIGRTSAQSQRYLCSRCGKRYTPEKKKRGYGPEIKQEVIGLFREGYRPREIGRRLQIHHGTVSRWIDRYLDNLS